MWTEPQAQGRGMQGLPKTAAGSWELSTPPWGPQLCTEQRARAVSLRLPPTPYCSGYLLTSLTQPLTSTALQQKCAISGSSIIYFIIYSFSTMSNIQAKSADILKPKEEQPIVKIKHQQI